MESAEGSRKGDARTETAVVSPTALRKKIIKL